MTTAPTARRFVLPGLLSLATTLVGCVSSHRTPFKSAEGESLSTIRHIVLIDLKDATEVPELIRAMDAGIAHIPGIVHYWRGEPFRSDRPEVSAEYDVGLVVDFRDAAAYSAYVTDERHVTLVRTWKPRCNSLTVYDIRPSATDR